MRDALQKAGFEEPMLQNFGSSHDIMVRMPPAEGETGGQVLGSQVLKVINESTNQNAAVKRIEFVGPSVGGRPCANRCDGVDGGAAVYPRVRRFPL